jgi:aspartate kinase
MKFGGTSVADLERIRRVARLVNAEVEAGRKVAVVVSAMAGKTNELVAWTDGAGAAAQGLDPSDDEYDVVVASGEQVTAGLLSMTLRNMGVRAKSWLGWQIPIITDEAHGRARIDEIPPEKLAAAMDAGEVAVIAGFQGVTRDGRLTTLGRGGSDTSAVALAAAVGADRCDIYTDVDGVYTTDPRIVPRARKLPAVTYAEMLELASVGAKVLQTRSVGLAMREKVPVRVLSSFEDRPGTWVVGDDRIGEFDMERQLITGIAYDKNEARVTLTCVPHKVGSVAAVFAPLADAAINVDMIVQSVPREGQKSDLTFTVPTAALAQTRALLEKRQAEIGFEELLTDTNVVKVSAVGVGMRSNAGIAAQMFEALAARGINILAISTSEIKVSVLIAEEYTELAVRVLHTSYGLDAEETA